MHIKVLVDHFRTVEIDVRHDRPDLSGPDCVEPGLVDGLSVSVEYLPGDAPADEHIVVKIDKVLGQTLDAVDTELDRMGTESRKIFLRHIVGVLNMYQLVGTQIKPVRDMSAGHKIDLVDPGRELLHSAKPVPECSPVAVSRLSLVDQEILLGRVKISLRSPLRIAVVHPQENEINRVIPLRILAHRP